MNKQERIKYFNKNPWAKTKSRISTRCSKSQIYGKRGIKNQITTQELKTLWFRDKAYLMKEPSIDRINSKGNYEFNNCRYIELFENKSRANINRNYKSLHNSRNRKIKQISIFGNTIELFDSIAEASKQLNICASSISECAKHKRKTAGKYIWRYE